MLIKSRPRGPFGPLTDFSCNQNVLYMASKMSKNQGQKRRPSSAPTRKNVAANPKRVLQGSKPEAKLTSKYHERCMPSHWVPAPGKATQSSKTFQRFPFWRVKTRILVCFQVIRSKWNLARKLRDTRPIHFVWSASMTMTVRKKIPFTSCMKNFKKEPSSLRSSTMKSKGKPLLKDQKFWMLCGKWI